MPLNCKTLAEGCLDFIDIHTLGEASTAQRQWVCNAINGALQELWQNGPPHFKRRELSGILHGATPVIFLVSPNSANIYDFQGWADWMPGCTVRIDGDTYDNEIVDGGKLLQPFQGSANGVVRAQVFGDCLNLDPSVSSILGCVRLADIRELEPSPNREAFNRANYWHEGDYGEALLSVQVRRKWTGQPHTYWVDTVFLPSVPNQSTEPGVEGNIYQQPSRPLQPVVRLRVAPIPQQQYIAKFDCEMNPQSVDVDTLENPNFVFQLPGHNDELILQAFVLQRWTACPWWKNNDAKTEIGRQFGEAYKALYGTKPQTKRARRFVPVI